jgi:excisionase family DNA binding protein
MERLLLRPHEAAELLGLGRSTVDELIASGAIPSITVGRSRARLKRLAAPARPT